MVLRRGDVAVVDFSPAREGEANFERPAIVITNNIANARSPVVVVVPITSNVDRVYPFQVLLEREETGLDRDSKAQIELIRHVSVGRVRQVVAQLPLRLMNEVDDRLREHLGL